MELLTVVHNRKIDYIPIIYAFAREVESHILFYDHEDKKYAIELKDAIEKFEQNKGLKSEIQMLEVDEDSKNDMQNITKQFKEENQNLYLMVRGQIQHFLQCSLLLFYHIREMSLLTTKRTIATISSRKMVLVITKSKKV